MSSATVETCSVDSFTLFKILLFTVLFTVQASFLKYEAFVCCDSELLALKVKKTEEIIFDPNNVGDRVLWLITTIQLSTCSPANISVAHCDVFMMTVTPTAKSISYSDWIWMDRSMFVLLVCFRVWSGNIREQLGTSGNSWEPLFVTKSTVKILGSNMIIQSSVWGRWCVFKEGIPCDQHSP